MGMIKRMQSLILWVAWAILIGSSAAYADTFAFGSLPPSGDVSGPAGSTVGWGYVITDPSPDNWLVLTGLSAGSFLNGTPDSSLFDFPILAPQTTLSVPFDPVNGTGLFALTWDTAAPAGFVNSGNFILSGQ